MKKILFLLCISLATEYIASTARMLRGPISLPGILGFILFFIVTYYFISNYKNILKPSTVLFCMLSFPVAVSLILAIIYFPHTAGSWLSEALFWLGAVAAYAFYKSNTALRVSTIILSLMLLVFVYYKGEDLWMKVVNEKIKKEQVMQPQY